MDANLDKKCQARPSVPRITTTDRDKARDGRDTRRYRQNQAYRRVLSGGYAHAVRVPQLMVYKASVLRIEFVLQKSESSVSQRTPWTNLGMLVRFLRRYHTILVVMMMSHAACIAIEAMKKGIFKWWAPNLAVIESNYSPLDELLSRSRL